MTVDSKCDVVFNNIVETFNAYIVHFIDKHCIDMLEEIRASLMKRIYVKKGMMEPAEDELYPRLRLKLEKEKEEARNCHLIPLENKIFQVTHRFDNLMVDMGTASCTCRKWDLIGIPCRHAIASATWLKQDAEVHVHSYFKKESICKHINQVLPIVLVKGTGLKWIYHLTLQWSRLDEGGLRGIGRRHLVKILRGQGN